MASSSSKIVPTSKPPCRLKPGEGRRVSQNRARLLIGYHVSCPRCGFVMMALHHHQGLVITEGDALDDIVFSRPLRCIFCRVLVHVDHGEFALELDAEARNVRRR